MYRCNLSFRQLHAYLDLLLDRRLLRKLEKNESSRQELYETTSRGRAFLEAYKSIRTLLAT